LHAELEEFEACIRRKRERVEDHMRSALNLARGAPASLLEAMEYSLCAPGKRLRPILVLMAAEACGDMSGRALAAASAVEMVHTYSLIHDDLPAMDDDDLRRGLPTCHRKFGEALAILAGDALLTLAFQVLAESYPVATAAGCCRELACGAGAAGMVGGQVEDLAWENAAFEPCQASDGAYGGDGATVSSGSPTGSRVATLSTVEDIHARKTGALFRTCLRLGAWAAQGENSSGPDSEILHALDEYGRCFGQAFQITDDLLDVEGQAEQTGKRVGKDATRGKLTYPSFLGNSGSRNRAQRLCEEARSALRPVGPAGEPLALLSEFLVTRRN
jgi:geranylgeranyl diphosphate synthase type II